MKMEWFFKIEPKDLKKYKPEQIIFGYDRLNGEYLTYGGIADRYGKLKEAKGNNPANSSD